VLFVGTQCIFLNFNIFIMFLREIYEKWGNMMKMLKLRKIHCVPTNNTALACYNIDLRQPILIMLLRK